MKRFNLFFHVFVCQSLIFSNILWASEQLSLPTPDITAPEVHHSPVTEPVLSESEYLIQATVTDNVGVKSVTLFYRIIGDQNYQQRNMKRVGITDTYSANFPKMPDPGIEYYIQAEDLAGNTLLHGYSFSPLIVKTQPAGPAPAQQELAGAEPPQPPPPEPVSSEAKEKSSTMKWVWIGVGVLVVGAIAAAASGGDDGGGGTEQGTVVVSGPTPQ